jgi:hypothetical protein
LALPPDVGKAYGFPGGLFFVFMRLCLHLPARRSLAAGKILGSSERQSVSAHQAAKPLLTGQRSLVSHLTETFTLTRHIEDRELRVIDSHL